MKRTLFFIIAFMLLLSLNGCTLSNSNTNINLSSNATKTIMEEDKKNLISDEYSKVNQGSTTKEILEINKHSNIIEATTVKENGNLKFNNEGIPILMYHSVKYEKDNPVRIAKEKFREQMKYLKDNGYTTLTLDEAYAFFQSNTPVPIKSVVLTFDDGYIDNYTTAYPILKEYGFKATIFVITGYIGKGEYLTETQIKELDEYGMDIQSHTVNHENLSELSYDKQLGTLKESKVTLESILNKEIKYIAYPYGKYNKDTVKAAETAGYKLALTTDGKWSDKTDGIFTLDRVYISGFINIDAFKNRISNPEYSF